MKHAMIDLLVFASRFQAHCIVVLPDLPEKRLELQQKDDVRLWGQGRNDGLLNGYAFTRGIKSSVYSTVALPIRCFARMTGHSLQPLNNHYIVMTI